MGVCCAALGQNGVASMHLMRSLAAEHEGQRGAATRYNLGLASLQRGRHEDAFAHLSYAAHFLGASVGVRARARARTRSSLP